MNGATVRIQLDRRAQARAEAMRAAVHQQIPEALPWIRDLIAAGLIEGWRDVSYVGPPRTDNSISADRIELKPKEHKA